MGNIIGEAMEYKKEMIESNKQEFALLSDNELEKKIKQVHLEFKESDLLVKPEDILSAEKYHPTFAFWGALKELADRKGKDYALSYLGKINN